MVHPGQREIDQPGAGPEADADSDEALIVKALALRDTRSFDVLVDRHQSRVRAYLRRMTREPALADDLAQETFIRAWNKLASFSGKGSFASWLMSIAHNQFLQAMRKMKRDRRLLDEVSAASEDIDMPSATPRSSTEGELPDLPKLLAVLSAAERSVMLLGYGFGFSHSEITEVTGFALGTVKSHIHRSKAKIREKFSLGELGNA
ncbi:MAG: RNA polymerase sigma factor [Gammaproteobacteria bacterium]